MKIIVFSQLYRSKSATLEMAYDMENTFHVMYYLISHQTTECKKNRTYIRIESDRTLNESVWNEINRSRWYEIKLVWDRNRVYGFKPSSDQAVFWQKKLDTPHWISFDQQLLDFLSYQLGINTPDSK